MVKTVYIVLMVIAFIVVSFFLLCFFLGKKYDSDLKKWDTSKDFVEDSELKKDIMKIHKISEDECIQSVIGIWIIANVETDDIKKLMKLDESLGMSKNVIEKSMSEIHNQQKFLRSSFAFTGKNATLVWDKSYLTGLIKKLIEKREPSNLEVNDTEQDVIKAFCNKHKSGEDVFNKKINGGKGNLTFIENAIKCLPSAFENMIVSHSS